MDNLITVVSLQGQAWAVAQDGSRRELQVGDTIAANEMVVTAEGAQIDLQFANNQVLSLIGEQEASAQALQAAEALPLSAPLTAIHTPQTTSVPANLSGNVAKEGHNFVQLVRIAEIIEANGLTPLTVARIQEIIKPLGMVLPERDFEQDRWKDNVSYREHGSNIQYSISIDIDVIADDDIINAAEAQRDITVTGTVGGDVKPGDKVTVTVNGKTYETTVNADGKTWNVDIPGSELVQDKTVEATVTGKTPTGETITADTERPYEVRTELPKVEVELEGAGPDGVYSESEIINGKVPAIVTLDPNTVKEGDILKVTTPNGDVLLERPVTQDDINNGVPIDVPVAPGDKTVIVEATITNPEGNTGTGRDEKPVDNITPKVEIQLEGVGPDGVYNESEIKNGKVPATVTLDKDTVKVGDTLVVKTPNGDILLERPVTQEDIDNGVPVQVPVTPGQTTVTVEATITDPAGNSSSSSDTKPVDNLPPELVGVLQPQNDADADDITLDLSKEFNDLFSGKDLTYQAAELPKGLLLDPNTGIISGKIDSSASQGGNTGTKGDYKVTITVTDPAGNSSEHEFIWTVTNPPPVASDDKGVTDENTSLVVAAKDGVLQNDNDPDGDQLYVTGIVAGETKPAAPGGLNTEIKGKYGTLTLQEDGSYVYTPNKDNPEVRALKDGKTLEDTFSYTITDREGGEDNAVLRITINGVTDGDPTIVPEDKNGTDPTDPLTAGHATVYESGLVAGGPAGQSKTATGDITVDAKDGLISVTVGSETLDLDALTALSNTTPVTITTDYGVLTLIGFTPEVVNGITVGGKLSYSYELTKPFANAEPGQAGDENGLDKIDLKVVDAGKTESSGTLDINIIDDVPVARYDANSITEDTTVPATGNVFGSKNASVGDVEDSQGADGAIVTGVQAGAVAADTHVVDGNLATAIPGKYGTLTLNADGTYSYELDSANLAVQGLSADGTLNDEVFSYTITDSDGDQSTATLTITINGSNDIVIVDVPTDHNVPVGPDGKPTDSADYTKTDDHVVFESGLANGSNPDADATKVVSSFTLKALDGLAESDAVTITYNGGELTLSKAEVEALGTDPKTINTPYGDLVLNGYSQDTDPSSATFGTITIAYNYTLNTAPTVSGDATNDVFGITVKDKDTDQDAGTISIKIIDDAPVAVDDKNQVTEGDGIDAVSTTTGSVIGTDGAIDPSGGDNVDTTGADGATVTDISSTNVSGNVATETNGVLEIKGEYGTLTIQPDGSYTYELDNSNLDVQGMIEGGRKTDTFKYTIKDGDGDEASADLVITINGANDGVTVKVPNLADPNDPSKPGEDYPVEDPDNSDNPTWGTINDHVVFESGLVGGSQNNTGAALDNLVKVKSSFTLSALDGLDNDEAITFNVDGQAAITLTKTEVEALGDTPKTVITEHGNLVLNGFSQNTDPNSPDLGKITIDYEYTLSAAPENSAAGDGSNADKFTDDTIKITVKDRDGDDDNQNLIIRIMDDVPVATPDEKNIDEGALLTVSAIGGVLVNDQSGADGWASTGAVVGVAKGDTGTTNAAGVGTEIEGQYGTLKLNADGSYTYQAKSDITDIDVQDIFTYTVQDTDGDLSHTTLTINVADISLVKTETADSVQESGLIGGSTEGSGHIKTGTVDLPSGQTVIPVTDADTTYGTFSIDEDGNYTYTLTETTTGDDVTETITYTAKDANGNTVENTITITIVDDEPSAKDDTDTVAAGDYTAEEGNVITGEGTNEGKDGTGTDVEGADGASITEIQFGANTIDVPETGKATIEGTYGTLEIEATGDYSYTRKPGTPGGVNDKFTYTLTDGDGDEATATLTINIVDSEPEITDLTPALEGGELVFDEKHLPEGTEPTTSELTKAGDFKITSGDGIKSLTATDKDGNAITIIENGALTTADTITTASGTLKITSYDSTTGTVTYKYTLSSEKAHGEQGSATDEELFESISIQLTDYDDQTADANLVVKIIDDIPVVTSDVSAVGSLAVDETNFVNGSVTATDADFVKDVFDVNYGAGGDAGTIYSLEVTNGTDSGLLDTATGSKIYLHDVGGVIVGHVGVATDPANINPTDTSAVAFKISIDSASGEVSLTQQRPLQHPTAGPNVDTDHNESVPINSDSIKLHATAKDGDGDIVKSAGIDVGGKFTFFDDGPSFTAPADTPSVDEKNLSTGSDPLTGSDTVVSTGPIELGVDFGADNKGGSLDVRFTSATKTDLETWLTGSNNTGLTVNLIDDHTLTATKGSDTVFTVTLAIDPDTAKVTYEFVLNKALTHTTTNGVTPDLELPFNGLLITDADGDTTTGNFSVAVKDDAPQAELTITTPEDVTSTWYNTSADANLDNVKIIEDSAEIGGTLNAITGNMEFSVTNGTVIVNASGQVSFMPNADYSNHGGADTFTARVTDNNDREIDVAVTVNVTPVSDSPSMDGVGGPSTGGDVILAAVDTLEDVAVALGLKTPIITDNTDQNAGEAGDAPERLGVITLELSGSHIVGAKLFHADGSTLVHEFTTGAPINIWLTDVDHPLDLIKPAGAIEMTSAEYEGLQLLPAEHRSDNIDVSVKATSHEVDDSGNIAVVDGTQVAGATAKATLKVYVQAVTDDVALTFAGGVTTGTSVDVAGNNATEYTVAIHGADSRKATVTLDEDTGFKIKDFITAAFEDLDGSEQRFITIANPAGSGESIYVFNGEDWIEVQPGADITIDAKDGQSGQTGKISSFPDIAIGAKPDFSGKLDGITITINAQDKDADGFNTGNENTEVDGVVEDDKTNNTVTIDLRVNPVAGDVAAGNVETKEDTAVAFLQHVRVTDTGTEHGTEVIDSVAFKIPDGWAMTDSTVNNGAAWSIAESDGTHTITFTNGTEAEREAVLKGFMIKPPAHSSKDATIELTITSTDTNSTTGSNTKTVTSADKPSLAVTVKVTPVAERTDTDSDDAGGNDVTMNGNHVYQTSGEEDLPFDLGVDDTFKLSAVWSNEDGKWERTGENWAENTDNGRSEDTFALLTPYTTVGNSAQANATVKDMLEGSVFTYIGPNGPVTIPFAGEPVKIPMQYLDTVKFTGPKDWSGVVKIKVQAGTIDYDEDDDSATELEVSGESWLTNLIIEPRADQVTLKVDTPIKTLEDTPVKLNIVPTSSDKNETFDVTISGIPKGATIKYWENGTEKTFTANADNSSLSITNFDKTNQPKLTPPKDSNEPINLTVKAESVDTLTYIDKDGNTQTITDKDPSKAQELPINVEVQGVPDEPLLELVQGKEYLEDNNNDEAGLSVDLKELITKFALGETGVDGAGTDGSETVTLRITDLPEGFTLTTLTTLTGAGPQLGAGSGTERVWVISKADLDKVQIVVPEHYSGTVKFTIQPVVTENDNPSEVFFDKQNVSFKVKPVAEASLSVESNLLEDIIRQLSLTAVGADSNEYISAVRISAADVTAKGLTLHAADGTLLTPSADGFYTFTYDGLNSPKAPDVYVKGPANYSGDIKLNIGYTVTDPVADGTITAATKEGTVEHTLNFAPVTDKIDLSLGSIDGGATVGGVTTQTNPGSIKVKLNIEQKVDPNADASVNDGKDIDNSEQLTHILITGVPAGVSVKGAVETAKGQWLITITSEQWNGNATLEHELEFVVSGYAAPFTGQTVTITTYSKDTGAANYEKDSVEWKLTYERADKEQENDLPTVTLAPLPNPQESEDKPFSLNKVVAGTIGAHSGDYNVTLTIRTKEGDNTTFDGMTATQVVENDETITLWTKTEKVSAGQSGQEKLEQMLENIKVNTPKDANSSDLKGASAGADGKLKLDINLSVHTDGISRDAQAKPEVIITPVTDDIAIGVSTNTVDEGVDVALNITLPTDTVDGELGAAAGWTIVDGKVYIHLADGALAGQLTDALGNPLVEFTGTEPDGTPAGGKLYAVDADKLAGLKFVPDATKPHQTGKLDITVLVKNQEQGAGNIEVSIGTGSVEIQQSNSGYEAAITAIGAELQGKVDDQLIKLDITGQGLKDKESDEVIDSAFISGLPDGFTVWVGDPAKMASNAGGGTWAIPLEANNLPANISIKPPKNWSGTLEDLKFTVMSGHAGLTPTASDISFDLVVNPVANGIEMNPTLSFGDAGDKIELNLNASMKDPSKATGAAGDQYTELTELSLSGFPDGQKVQFFIGDSEVPLDGSQATFDGSTWTITGLSQSDLQNLKFLHGEGSADITVKGRTYEVNAAGEQYKESGSDWSDAKTAAINISPTVPTSGADHFLWDGTAINGFGGEDTVQLRFGDNLEAGDFAKLESIEIINMKGANSGANSITGLTAADVLDMVGAGNTLKVLGDSNDTVSFSAGTDWVASTTGTVTTFTNTVNNTSVNLDVILTD